MNKGIKITLIGAGSSYTPELVEGFIGRSSGMKIAKLAFMDIDLPKMKIVAALAERMIRAKGLDWEIECHTDLGCIKGADFVLTQLRVGKLPARVIDEKIPLKYGFIGQETCGMGGFFKGLRTIPVLMTIAEEIRKHAPNAWMINFTNPSGMVTQALLDRGVKTIGLCNVPRAMELSVREGLGIEGLDIEYVGLNHLSWITGIRKGGKDYLHDAIVGGVRSAAMKNIPANGFPTELLASVGGIPSTYLEYYYFPQEKLQKMKKDELSRGEYCIKLERSLFERYKDANLTIKPPELSERGGAYYSEVAASLVDAIHNDKQERHIINTYNDGALSFMDDTDVVEIPAIVGKDGAKSIRVEKFDNGHVISLMRTVKQFEHFAVEAAITGSREAAVRAMLANPLIGDYNSGIACFHEMLEAHKDYLPQFGHKEEA